MEETMLCRLGCRCLGRGSVVVGCSHVVRSCCIVVVVVRMGWVVVVRMSWVVVVLGEVGMVGRVWLGV